MESSLPEVVATVCFGFAILHTLLVKRFQALAHRYPSGSVGENFFHLLGEVEVVFGLWAALYLVALASLRGGASAISYLESRNYTEPAFVFVILVVCATQPILDLGRALVTAVAKALPLPRAVAFYWSALVVGPLLGSLITEPAAMTITALILFEWLYSQKISDSLKYATIGLLFVNVSIGGVLTPYAAPPVLMVAGQWGWDLPFMMANFGWKGALAATISASIVTFRFRRELAGVATDGVRSIGLRAPLWVGAIHLLALAGVVVFAHHPVVFFGLFLFFLGLVTVTNEYQAPLRLREGLLVAFFLGGLVILGGPQRWWLEPLLTRLEALPLYLGAMTLTAFTDNAALTYLGAQVPGLSELSKYALVAGSVVGGGLTVIANAPNPAGYGVLNPAFGEDGISPTRLTLGALGPTLIAAAIFWMF